MTQKVTYKIGLNGSIDDSREFTNETEACSEAIKLWNSTQDEVTANVYGFCEYSDDDKTPIHARTTFWKHRWLNHFGVWKD